MFFDHDRPVSIDMSFRRPYKTMEGVLDRLPRVGEGRKEKQLYDEKKHTFPLQENLVMR
jgi:hypothetical protein